MKKIKNNSFVIFTGLVILFLIILKTLNQPKQTEIKAVDNNLMNQKKAELQMQMRKLWSENALWTRMLTIGIVNNIPEINQSITRLEQNINDISRSTRLFYGDEISNQFNTLMTDHLRLTTKLITETRNRSKSLTKMENDWYENANTISVFLSTYNPNWSKDELQTTLFNYLKLIRMEVDVRLKRDYKNDVNVFDMAHDQALSIADYLSAGIIKQFPDKF